MEKQNNIVFPCDGTRKWRMLRTHSYIIIFRKMVQYWLNKFFLPKKYVISPLYRKKEIKSSASTVKGEQIL